MSLKSANTKFLLICAGVVVVALGTFGYFTYTDMQRMDELEQDSQALAARVRKADLEIKKIPSLEDVVLILREQVKKDVAILPDDQEIHAFVDKLTEFERSAGVVVTKLDDTQARQRRNARRRSTKAFESITYKLTLQGTTPQLIAFMDLLENKYERFVRIPAFKVAAFDERTASAGGKSVPLDFERQHSIDLELETYVYNPKRKGKDHVEIPGEQRKLERLMEQDRIGSSESEFALVRHDVKPKPGRRDPFVDPRLDSRNRVTEEDRREQLQTLEDLKGRLQALREAIALEGDEKNTILRMQLEDKNNNELKSFASLVQKRAEDEYFTARDWAKEFASHVLGPTNQLMAEREQQVRNEVSMADVRTRVEDMRKATADSEWGLVVSKHDEIKQLLAKLEAPASAGPLLDEAEALVTKARAYRDFDALKLDFGGAVVYEADPSQAVVIINGRAFSPAEVVADGLTIKAITKSSVVFVFRGLEMTRRQAN